MKGSRQIAGLAAAVAAGMAFACSPPRRPNREEPPLPTPRPAAEPSSPVARELPPPTPREVGEVVERVFGDAAVPDGRGRFLVGDFNGDLSQDLAVVVKPARGKVDALNAEYPRWMLKDPMVPPDQAAERPRVKAAEPLLAIVHGHGPQGWRDPEATQTYLLKNAVGSQLKTHRGTEFVKENSGRRLPRIQGDLIGEVLGGAQGYLYYTGPTYAWYDPRTFAGEPERRIVHGRGSR